MGLAAESHEKRGYLKDIFVENAEVVDFEVHDFADTSLGAIVPYLQLLEQQAFLYALVDSADTKQLVFAANRVTERVDSSNIDQWRHVEGTLTPANIGT